jgi:hypothetical protein
LFRKDSSRKQILDAVSGLLNAGTTQSSPETSH